MFQNSISAKFRYDQWEILTHLTWLMIFHWPDEYSNSTLLKWSEKCVKHDFEIRRWVEVRAIWDLKHCLGSSKIKTRTQQNKQLRNKMQLNCFKVSKIYSLYTVLSSKRSIQTLTSKNLRQLNENPLTFLEFSQSIFL